MSDLIKIKGGRGDVPALQDREIAYKKDEMALYVGTSNGNVLLCKANDVTKLAECEQRLNGCENRLNALEDKDDQICMFYATYGVTTGEEINEAFTAGKAVACKLGNGRILWLNTDWKTGTGFTFSSAEYNSVVSVEVDGEYWTDPITTEFATKEEINEINARLEALENK